jgi:hypothetical protein
MSELNTSGKLIDQVVKPLMNGAMCYVGAKALGIDRVVFIPFTDKAYDAPMGLAILGTVSSFGTELAHNFILPHINQHSKLGQMESMILSPVLNGGMLTGLVYAGSRNSLNTIGAGNLFGIGAGAEVTSTYAFEAVARPFLHSRN